MRLSREVFLDRYRAGRLQLALIGMSNAGKSRSAQALARERGFRWISVDDEIERVFPGAGRLDRRSTAAPSSRRRQRRNLEREAACLAALPLPTRGNIVLDTTGSLVHLPEEVTQPLRAGYLVVYLEVPAEDEGRLAERIFEAPKDLYWGSSYDRRAGESMPESLRRSFAALYAWRRARYQQLADITVAAPLDDARSGGTLWTLLLTRLEADPPDRGAGSPADGSRR